MKIQILLSSLILTLLTTSGCMGLKTSGNKGGKTYYETFFVGEQGTQYFIKPISFTNENSQVKLDITFRYKDEIKDSATISFSILGKTVLKKINHFNISSGQNKIPLHKINLLFNEKRKDLITSRFSGKVLLKDLHELFKSTPWEVQVNSPTLNSKYTSSKKANKVISTLQENVFVIF